MLTSLSPAHPTLDVLVPSDDVAMATGGERPATARRTTAIVTEIGASAAWLAWQIDASDVLIHEARSQLERLGANLERYHGRMPEDVRKLMLAALQTARTAADRNDLSGVAQSARDVRAVADHYRAATLAC